MKPSKLLSSMAISITTMFVILGWTLLMTYSVVQTLGAGIGGFSFELVIFVILPLLIALSTIFIIIFGFVGAHKAKNNPENKGVFVTMAIFQMIALVSMLTFGGYWLYVLIQVGAYTSRLEMEGWLYIYPTLCGGIALLVAFIKNCAGMRRKKVESQEPIAQTRPVPPPPPVPPMYNNQ